MVGLAPVFDFGVLCSCIYADALAVENRLVPVEGRRYLMDDLDAGGIAGGVRFWVAP